MRYKEMMAAAAQAEKEKQEQALQKGGAAGKVLPMKQG